MTALVVLLGHGIGYSASPAMHNAAFRALGIDARYQLRDVPAGALAEEVADLREAGQMGANVTKPHKIAVCELVDERSLEVERLGAANTIVRRDGRLVAHNTDLGAIRDELTELMRRHRHGFDRALILGAGGAARAASVALEEVGCRDVSLLRRAAWVEMAERIQSVDVLVNATPIGTESDESPIPASLLRADLAVLDLVYRPVATRLVRDARAIGALATSGAGVLLRQAAASFALWTGREAPIDVMGAALYAELGASARA